MKKPQKVRVESGVDQRLTRQALSIGRILTKGLRRLKFTTSIQSISMLYISDYYTDFAHLLKVSFPLGL